jgi:LPXTG-motif cell wall-anchored protein
VDKTAPAGTGIALSIGSYADSNGDCVYSGGDSFYSFDILAAGSDAGDGGEAEPQTGGSSHTKPAGDTEIGSLAETGSSSALPYIALAGGAAVAFGGGAMFVVRRRKSV